MGVIAPVTCPRPVSGAARPLRRLEARPELNSDVAGGKVHGSWSKEVPTDGTPIHNEPANAVTPTHESVYWQQRPATVLGIYTAAQVDSSNGKRKRQDASGVHVYQHQQSKKPPRAGKDRVLDSESNGKRLCATTQHTGDGPNEAEDVLSISPTITVATGSAPMARVSPRPERPRSSYSVEYPTEVSHRALGSLSQGGATCKNNVYRVDVCSWDSNLFSSTNDSTASHPTETTTPHVQLSTGKTSNHI